MKRMTAFVWLYPRYSMPTISAPLVSLLKHKPSLAIPTVSHPQAFRDNRSSLHADAASIGDAPIPVLQVLVETNEASDSTTRWCTARREITALLDDHGFQELEVDIYDPKRYYQSSIFPIHPSHPAVVLFTSVQDELIKLVCTRIKSAWNLFSLFQVGLADNAERPAVVLMVAPLAEHDWASLKASLEEIIAGKEIGHQSGLRVEIMPGCTS